MQVEITTDALVYIRDAARRMASRLGGRSCCRSKDDRRDPVKKYRDEFAGICGEAAYWFYRRGTFDGFEDFRRIGDEAKDDGGRDMPDELVDVKTSPVGNHDPSRLHLWVSPDQHDPDKRYVFAVTWSEGKRVFVYLWGWCMGRDMRWSPHHKTGACWELSAMELEPLKSC